MENRYLLRLIIKNDVPSVEVPEYKPIHHEESERLEELGDYLL